MSSRYRGRSGHCCRKLKFSQSLAVLIDILRDPATVLIVVVAIRLTSKCVLAFREASEGLMHIKIAIAASLTLLATASSRADGNKACMMKAAEMLPRISGLVIKKTRTRPVPASTLATWKGQTRPIIVDVDIVAAGTEETYSYICVLTKGSAYVRRVMS